MCNWRRRRYFTNFETAFQSLVEMAATKDFTHFWYSGCKEASSENTSVWVKRVIIIKARPDVLIFMNVFLFKVILHSWHPIETFSCLRKVPVVDNFLSTEPANPSGTPWFTIHM